MKTVQCFIFFLLFTTATHAQIDPHTPWIWMKGDNNPDQAGVYGNFNTPNINNKPGGRVFSTTWKDNNGNLWLFGGMGHGASDFGYLNDLWKYKITDNTWTWSKGDSAINNFSVYGTKGTPHNNNKPGSASSAVTWTDASGNLWLFGGFGYTGNDFGFLNTLWKFNPSTNQWTWVNGGKLIDEPGVYGTMGTENATNRPGARYGGSTWTDASGNLWMFGGYGYDGSSVGMLNDIWKYNPANNRWTWVKGDKFVDRAGIYGTKGVSSPTNQPGSRYVTTTWADGYGSVWMFGGFGFDMYGAGTLGDLWKYNMATNTWTWMHGENSLNAPGEYGTQGIASPSNQPGARYVSTAWVDKNKELWLFGGYGSDAENTGYLNDFWKFSPSTNQWAWVKGDNTVDQYGIYGTQGTASQSNKTGARNASVSWADTEGNLWLFGGYGFDDNTSGSLNDLWKITYIETALPLHLVSFSGVMNNREVMLDWKAEQEINFSHFNIQRSFNGTDFSTIAQVNGAGSGIHLYDYKDAELKNHAFTKVFYRLQMMDHDGTFNYSKILRFDITNAASPVTLFPNPASNHINISFTQSMSGTTSISITAMNGVTVRKLSAPMQAGRTSMQTDISGLPSGSYILSVQGPDMIEHIKFTKQ